MSLVKQRFTVADSISDEECSTIEELAKELGVSVQRARQLVAKAFGEKWIPKQIKIVGKQHLYTSEVVRKFKEMHAAGRFGTPRKRDKSVVEKDAVLVVKVPIYDKQVAEFLLRKFKTMEEIQKFLRIQLENTYRPAMKKLEELRGRHQRELEEAMASL